MVNHNGNPVDTMELWYRRCETNPGYTRRASKSSTGKGYLFTEIDPQYQLMCATDEWGPYGSAWGLRNLKWGSIGDGVPVSITLDCEFFYPGGSFEISNDMAFKPHDECRKKLLTNTRSKSLSLLGFNADVFMGRFEDSAYVAEMKRKQEAEESLQSGRRFVYQFLHDKIGCRSDEEESAVLRFVTSGEHSSRETATRDYDETKSTFKLLQSAGEEFGWDRVKELAMLEGADANVS